MRTKTHILVWLSLATVLGNVACGESSSSRKPTVPISPGDEEELFGCDALPRKTEVGIPVSEGTWVARPTAYVILAAENISSEPNDLVSVSISSINPAPYGPTKIELEVDNTWKIGFRPNSIGLHEVTLRIQQNKSTALCKTKINFSEFPAEEDVIYIDEEWLEDPSNGSTIEG